jgi:LDH2 family malate/lactate/ureidoglycolate dehydrogenase
MNVPENDCARAADVLVKADLRGVETHGVSNMLRVYVNGYNGGTINPRPNWRVLRETPSTANIDSDGGLGIIITPKAMEIAIEKASKSGVGIVTIRNSGHLGMASYHAMMALEHDMIGTCMTACPPLVVPTFGAEPRIGTNPIAVAAPANEEPPFVFDAAMCTVAGNKLRLAQRVGRNLLPGWVTRPDGSPAMEEVSPPESESLRDSGIWLLPLGSTRELGSHKGYGLMAIVEVLGGILSGGGYVGVPGITTFGHYVAAYDIEAFMDASEFKSTMDDWVRMLQSTKTAPGHDRVLYPGLPEAEVEADRTANGIPLHPEVIEWFQSICAELSLPFTLAKA